MMRRFTGSNFVGGDWQNGFGVRFERQPDDSLRAEVVFDELKQGPPGYAHGGAIAAVLDEAMTATCFELLDGFVLTVSLNISYERPVLIGLAYYAEGRVEREEGRKIFLNATITSEEGLLCARATSLFLRVPSQTT